MNYEVGDIMTFVIRNTTMIGEVVEYNQLYSEDRFAVETEFGIYPTSTLVDPCNKTKIERYIVEMGAI